MMGGENCELCGQELNTFTYDTDGWGITNDGKVKMFLPLGAGIEDT